MTTVDQMQAPDLKPAGGTPFSKLFSCCLPKNESASNGDRKKRHITFNEEPPKEISNTREMKLEMEDDDNYEEIPDMDDPKSAGKARPLNGTTEGKRKQENWVMDFWRMMFNLLFLQFLRDAQEKKRLKNDAAKSE